MEKVTYDDLFALVDEIEKGAKNKSRTIDDVGNSTVRRLLTEESSMAIKAGVTAAILGAGVAGTAVTSALIGSFGGAGMGAVSASLTTLGVVAFSATGGATAGGAAGSFAPGIGTVIGAIVGAGIGIFAGSRIKKKNDEKKEALKQQVISKQNRYIKDLEAELEELKQKYGTMVEQNNRYKYIIGILMANEELKKCA